MHTNLTTLSMVACSGQGEGMTLEEQKTKLAAARAKAQGALGSGQSEAHLGSSWGSRGVRGVPLGCDREGACHWNLKAAHAFGGGAPSVVMHWLHAGTNDITVLLVMPA